MTPPQKRGTTHRAIGIDRHHVHGLQLPVAFIRPISAVTDDRPGRAKQERSHHRPQFRAERKGDSTPRPRWNHSAAGFRSPAGRGPGRRKAPETRMMSSDRTPLKRLRGRVRWSRRNDAPENSRSQKGSGWRNPGARSPRPCHAGAGARDRFSQALAAPRNPSRSLAG